MKRTFLLLFFLAFSFVYINAQIVITSDDIVPIGYIADQTTDTLPDISILEGGIGNIDWDFMALADGLDAEFVLLNVDSTPYAASFPNTNLATQLEPGLFAYMVMDNDKIVTHGVEGNVEIFGVILDAQLSFSPGQSLIRFPAAYGDSYEETIVQSGQVTGAAIGFPTFDSVRAVITLNRKVEIDAWGEMKIPTGTYNTIRSTEIEASETQGFILSSGVWLAQGDVVFDTLINYNWWTIEDSIAFPVVSMEYDPTDGLREVTWLKELTSSVENLFETAASLYPNPASDFVIIEFNEPFDGELGVYNSVGQLVLSQKSVEAAFEQLDLSNCNPGVHYVVLKNREGRFVGHKKIITSK